jgi:hypothetical protein
MTGTLVDPPLFDAAELDDDVEPRFRVRRVQVRKAEKRRRRRLIMMVLGVLLVVAAAIVALYSPLLDVDHLDIEGLSHLDAATVGKASGIATGQQMVDLNTDRAVAGIERLPWVQRVTVARHWPDTVDVRVVERRPVARIQVQPAPPAGPAAGSTAGTPPADPTKAAAAPAPAPVLVVTTDSTVAGTETPLDSSLPFVHLDPSAAPVVGHRLPDDLAKAVEMIGALPESIAKRMVGASVSAAGDVDVEMSGHSHLILGTGDDVQDKFVAAESILGGSVDLTGLDRVDVSVPSAPVIQRGAGRP